SEYATTPLPALLGDFSGDDQVDGADLLVWQRGESPEPLSDWDLEDWERTFGTTASPNEVRSVPEPRAYQVVLCCLPWFWRRARNG
ncbi:MAG: hypothetical protein AAF961_05860, partial [Planctomycetota bacterium]